MIMKKMAVLGRYLFFVPLLFLSGCASHTLFRQFVLFRPRGPLAGADLHYMILDVAVMLGIIVPTTIITIYFLLKYRKTNPSATYDPKWSHSNLIEVVVWSVPILTVALLGYYSYKGSFSVNPYNPTIVKTAGVTPSAKARLDVDVITTDWQWLFIYPKQGIALANELVIPANTVVHFHMTSATVVNDFYIPNLSGMIDIMPGMRTKQVLVADKVGHYHGYSANFSGDGFSWMGFNTKVLTGNQFQKWANKVQQSPDRLTYARFNAFAQPTTEVGGRIYHFSGVSNGLFDHVIKAVMMGKVYTTPLPTSG